MCQDVFCLLTTHTHTAVIYSTQQHGTDHHAAQVAEACAFGVPDSKYGEIVGAVIVPKGAVANTEAFVKDVQAHAAKKLAAFKVWDCEVVWWCDAVTL